ncbi:MAG: TetR/AcrR family transcriptional regulator [Alcaligenaceae bacterium]|nr:TetR/AcrR family transcriptional regulator [Alcaligenaceae bacterium]
MNIELSPRATEIADQAKLLLAAGGYSGFSYADVSDRVHICKASIHHHFPSKAELVRTVVVRDRERANAARAELDRQFPEPLARLEAYTGHWSDCICEGTSSVCISVMLAAELPMIPKEVANEVRHSFEDLAAWLATILEDGERAGQFSLRDNAQVDALAVMSTVNGAMLTARALNKPEVFREITRAAISQLTSSG